MREVDNFLQKESAKLYHLLKDVQTNRKTSEKVWKDYNKKSNTTESKTSVKTYFQRHPKHISTSSSEAAFSPREIVPKPRNKKLTSRAVRSDDSYDYRRSQSESSVDVVTVREEIDVIHTEYWAKFPGSAHLPGGISGCGERNEKRAKIREREHKDDAKKEMKKICPKKIEKPKEIIDVNIDFKLNQILDKTMKCMEDIRVLIDSGVDLPDGDDDFDRRKKRSVEFASRFSRNYLYQLNRQVNDIYQMTAQLSENSNKNWTVRQKLVTSYQTLLQGLQAYYNHLPVSLTNAVPEKVRELLKLTSSLCEIHRSCIKDLNSNDEKENMLDVFEVRSRCLLEKINEKCLCESTSALMRVNPSEPVRGKCEKSERKMLKKKKSSKENRFAMYSIPGANTEVWRRACASLAKKKFNVSSKYKTANFKHRPPIVEKQPPQQKQIAIKANKLVEKSSSGRIRTKSALNDDNIQTLVQWHKDKGSELYLNSSDELVKMVDNEEKVPPNSNRSSEGKQDNLTNLLNQVVNTIKEDNKDVSQHQVKNILQALLDYVGGVQEVATKSQQDLRIESPKDDDDVSNKIETQEESKQLKWCGVEGFDETILDKVVDAVKRNQESIKRAKAVCVKGAKEDDATDKDEKVKPERKKSVTITGARNAKLICIKDEDSLIQEESNDNDDDIVADKDLDQEKEVEVKNEVKQDDFKNELKQSDVKNETKHVELHKTNSERVSKIKISRLPKGSLKCLKMLPKKFALDILEYKINYGKARKGNHMYKKSATKHPWILMGEIADKILDELIQEIGLEIQANGVIDHIYASEFAQ